MIGRRKDDRPGRGWAGLRARDRGRRAHPFYPAWVGVEVSWGPPPPAATVLARLVDVGRGGAAMLVACPPPAADVRLRLPGCPWVGVAADVVGVEPAADGMHRVRVRFREPCPDAFLRAAIFDRRPGGPRAGLGATILERVLLLGRGPR